MSTALYSDAAFVIIKLLIYYIYLKPGGLYGKLQCKFSRFDKNHMITINEIVTLYHGSKSGIRGGIAPISPGTFSGGS